MYKIAGPIDCMQYKHYFLSLTSYFNYYCFVEALSLGALFTECLFSADTDEEIPENYDIEEYYKVRLWCQNVSKIELGA